MFETVAAFVQAWKKESANTQKMLDELTDQSLKQPVTEGHRTLGRIAWHIVTTIPEMMERTGLHVKTVDPESKPLSSAKEIAATYAKVSSALLEQIESTWNDQSMKQTDDMYGEQWARGQTLVILINHELHHRGQMTILMRQAGLKVPGIYGPSYEEWGTFGMQPPEV